MARMAALVEAAASQQSPAEALVAQVRAGLGWAGLCKQRCVCALVGSGQPAKPRRGAGQMQSARIHTPLILLLCLPVPANTPLCPIWPFNCLQFARVYTPLILLLCLAMAALPWLLLSDPAAQRVRRRWQPWPLGHGP